MGSPKIFRTTTQVYGILITAFMLLAFAPKYAGLIMEEGIITTASNMFKSLINWYDDPTGFFISYIIGYVTLWKKPIWGSCIILVAGVVFFAWNFQNLGVLIFVIPTALVAILYLIYWQVSERT